MKLFLKVYALAILSLVGGILGLSLFMNGFFGNGTSMTSIMKLFLEGLV